MCITKLNAEKYRYDRLPEEYIAEAADIIACTPSLIEKLKANMREIFPQLSIVRRDVIINYLANELFLNNKEYE